MSYLGKTGACPKVQKEHHKLSTKVPEKAIQKAVEELLNILHLQYIRIPDGIYRTAKNGNWYNRGEQAKALKAVKGVPDITILLTDGRYICIELKKNGGKQSLGQKQFERSIGADNYHICYSVEDVKNVLITYGVLG